MCVRERARARAYVYHCIQRYIDAQTCIETANARVCSGSSLCVCAYQRVRAAHAISRLQPPRQSFKAQLALLCSVDISESSAAREHSRHV